MLNPIIYVTFHQDFRRAFKYLLCLQCSTMGSRLRAEADISQYGGSLGHLNNNGANGQGKGKATAKKAATLRANASWSQLDEKVVHFDSGSGGGGKNGAAFQQTALQSSSTVPLLSQGATAGGDSDCGNGANPREYELQSINTNGTVLGPAPTVTPGSGGIPVSLRVTTTFALTNTTTTTSARIAPMIVGDSSSTSSSPNDSSHQNGDVPLDYSDLNRRASGDTDESESTNGYNISIQIDPTNHEATITRNTLI